MVDVGGEAKRDVDESRVSAFEKSSDDRIDSEAAERLGGAATAVEASSEVGTLPMATEAASASSRNFFAASSSAFTSSGDELSGVRVSER